MEGESKSPHVVTACRDVVVVNDFYEIKKIPPRVKTESTQRSSEVATFSDLPEKSEERGAKTSILWCNYTLLEDE